MSGLEIAGLVLGILPVILEGARPLVPLLAVINHRWNLIRDVYRKDGIVAVLLVNALPDSSAIMDRINKVLAGTDADCWQYRQSLSSNMNMVAVAGAIIAQVGITAFTLEGVDRAHWTAAAFFVSSLVFGALSVYVSFIVQQELNGLISGADVADWLSRPLSQKDLFAKAFELSRHPAFRAQGADIENIENAAQLENGAADLQMKREVSILAAIMLATPASLLSLSLNAFVVGLGIYLGCAYTDGLIVGFGKGGSLGILVFYLFAAVVGTFMYSFPRLMKSSEQHDMEKTSGWRAQLEVLDQGIRDYQLQQGVHTPIP